MSNFACYILLTIISLVVVVTIICRFGLNWEDLFAIFHQCSLNELLIILIGFLIVNNTQKLVQIKKKKSKILNPYICRIYALLKNNIKFSCITNFIIQLYHKIVPNYILMPEMSYRPTSYGIYQIRNMLVSFKVCGPWTKTNKAQ